MEPVNPDPLERMVHQALRSLPDRRAPGSLAARIQAEIERRAAIPWWHKSYAYWPSWARAMFLVLAGAGAVAGLVLFSTTVAGVDLSGWAASLQPWLAFGRRVVGVVSWTVNFASMVVGSISPLWLYGALAMIVVSYLSLFGISATAYRFLWTRR